jgi:hypothetical protein
MILYGFHVKNGIQFYEVPTEMTTLPTSNISFSQIRDTAGLSGQVSMSQMSPYYGIPRINASISAFVGQKKALLPGLQYRIFRSIYKFDKRNGSYNTGPTSTSNGSTTYPTTSIQVSDGTFKINGNTIPQGIQIWTVPETGAYVIAAGGAAGGQYTPRISGYGMVVATNYTFTAGQIVCILVGQQGYGNAGAGAAGGGGGTFVTIYAGTGAFSTASQHTIILVAGGGGGVSNTNSANGNNASAGTSGTVCSATQPSNTPSTNGGGGGGSGLSGGNAADGSGNTAAVYEGSGGGGGGFIGYGGLGSYNPSQGRVIRGGNSFLSGGGGGSSFIGSGGFGGGGGSWDSGGGGGGYSGGQGSRSTNRQGGGGGGSYDINGGPGSAVQYTGWVTSTFDTAPATYSGGWCTGDGFCVISSKLTYFSDNTAWFDTRTENYNGLSSNFSSINDGTAGVIPNDNSWEYYSVEWTGYFYATVTGTHTFYTQSDDASYLWIGSAALSGFTPGNCLVNNQYGHSLQQAQGSISLTAGTYYPIRIQFGESSSGDNCYISFEAPGISRIYNLTGYVFHPLGTKSTFPGYSARLIKSASGTTIDDIYYINTNGTSTPTYCLMDNKWDGGGWMMMMKATRGTTFGYSSTYWTDTGTTLNTGSTDQTDANAKFNTMNYVPVKDVLAIWPDVGYSGGSIASTGTWTWLVNNYYGGGSKTTIVNGFSSANTRDSPDTPDPLNYSGFSYSIWSTQNPSRRHIFGGGNHLVYAGSTPNLHVRWGFLFNENDLNDYRSIDVHGGIGMEGGSYSAGDRIDCCQASTGLNRTMRFELYGR